MIFFFCILFTDRFGREHERRQTQESAQTQNGNAAKTIDFDLFERKPQFPCK